MKLNVLAWLKIELAYKDIALDNFINDATTTFPHNVFEVSGISTLPVYSMPNSV